MSLYFVALLAYCLFNEVEAIRRILYIVFAINFGSSAYDRFQKIKRKEFFLEIDEKALSWVMQETGKPVSIDWNDIRWIKKEKDDAVMIFRESSFSTGFSFAGFTDEEKIKILELIEENASKRQIRLINFSMPALVSA